MRIASQTRTTKETDIAVTWNLDGSGTANIDTGIGFLDHMLTLFCCHGGFDLTVTCKGDLRVDGHHTTEDVGIVLGKLLVEALGDKRGISRYGTQFVPMDEALVGVYLDISGRPYLGYGLDVDGKTGDFDCELAEEFFRAVASYGLITLHLRQLDGRNRHHILEAAFKAFGRALREAVTIRGGGVPSTKGMLE